MATYEHNALQNYKDNDGNIHIVYPVTKSDNVDGIENYATTMDMNTKIATKADYEEGTFSPYIMNKSIVPSSIYAEYKKVDRIVYIAIKFSFSTAIDTAQIGEILGLPFVVSEGNATGGFYPLSAKTANGIYAGLVDYHNYMKAAPCVSVTDLLGQQSTKVIRLYGQYETTA